MTYQVILNINADYGEDEKDVKDLIEEALRDGSYSAEVIEVLKLGD